MRIAPLRGAGATRLKCPACSLTCHPTALTAHDHCPDCGHERLIRLHLTRGGRGAVSATSPNRQARA
ncbi:hypothetical protein [Streptomyces noursei]|uniref:hypothetical protein n=1 Tax=Streptomyces noursei TaxID=1971 RepID=UPI001966CA86|nr:hypothetical protein [Streptomyces noursei]QRX90286.1 hypothetical protein JNO44_04890 [Streptomyces noursei]